MTSQRLIALPVVLLVLVLAGCGQPAEAMPRLDDPQEILEEAIRTTAELEFVHARLEAAVDGGGGSQRYTVDGDVDILQREFHAVLEMAVPGGASQRAEMLLLGTDLFSRAEGGELAGPIADGRWQRMPLGAGSDPRNGLPATAAIAVALKALLADPGVTATLAGMKPCADRQCDRVTATIAPELTWRAINGAFLGGQPEDVVPPADARVPELVLDVMVDEATRRLVSLATSVALEGQSVELAATLSNHDVEFELLPPPPDQVVDQPAFDNSGGVGPGVIVEQVDEGTDTVP